MIITQTMPEEIEIPLMPTYYSLNDGIKIVEPIEEPIENEEKTEES